MDRVTQEHQRAVMANVNRTQIPRPAVFDVANTLIRVSLLGPLSIEIAGAPVAIASKRARALVGFLIQRDGTEVARSLIAGLLWGDRAEEQARASLRQTLTELRAAFATSPSQLISATPEWIAWDAEAACRG